ncbi:MAG TPA: 30S ribosomal protein S6--L-glutamate ligase [Longimicrobiales bacterium]|nr:30S ribosomal protein S6--L-glutamate ligase [Longimicrobiales bacterium]
MKIGILSRKASLYSTRRLREAAEDRGHEVRVVDPLRCYMDITAKRPKVMFGGEELWFDAIIPRIGASSTFYGTAVVRQFEMAGAYTVAGSEAIARSRDKLRSLQILSGAGVGLPTTGFARSSRDIKGLISMVGGAPLILKLLEGTQGTGVVLAETRKAAESVIGAFRQLDANILLQEFIAEAKGADVRAFVVGDRVVASMERQAAVDEFRSNLHRGGTATPVKLTARERNTALRAARSMGLVVAGVDIIRSDRGPLVLEVNSSPGLQGIETTTGVDVAGDIIEYIESHVHEAEEAEGTAQGRGRRAPGRKRGSPKPPAGSRKTGSDESE